MTVRWVVHVNLGGQYVDDLKAACEKCGCDFYPEDHIPFSGILSEAPDDLPTVFYGATGWIDLIHKNNHWTPGVFFNPDSVCQEWIEKYGDRALNHGGMRTSFVEFSKMSHDPGTQFFVRPCSDQKEFAGEVMSFEQIKKWNSVLLSDASGLGTLPIWVAEPVGLSHEWRLFFVDGDVVAGSHYRSNHELDVNPDVPYRVIDFAKKRRLEYEPSPVFVMDIGQSNNLYVIEVGCFNSAGFYAANIEDIVKSVSAYALRVWTREKHKQ